MRFKSFISDGLARHTLQVEADGVFVNTCTTFPSTIVKNNSCFIVTVFSPIIAEVGASTRICASMSLTRLFVFSGVSFENSIEIGRQSRTEEGVGFCQITSFVSSLISLMGTKDDIKKLASEINSLSQESICLYSDCPDEPSQLHLLYKTKFREFIV